MNYQMIFHKIFNISKKKPSFVNFDYKNTNIDSKKNNILVANLISGHRFCSIIETSIAAALKLRGCKVSFLQCDKVLDACVMCISDYYINDRDFIKNGAKKVCDNCWNNNKNIFFQTGLPVKKLSKYINKDEIESIRKFFKKIPNQNLSRSYTYRNINIGEQSIAGCLRYLGKSEIKTFDEQEIKKKYFISSAILVIALTKLFSHEKYDTIFLNHGIYVPHGIIVEIAKKFNIRLVCYGKGYRKNTLILSEGETYHKTMINEKTSVWKNIILGKKLKNRLINYLVSRKKGNRDWTTYLKNPEKNNNLLKEIKKKPTVLILTNVNWDAQIYYKNNIFKNMNEWLIFTLKYFLKKTNLNVVVRIHPAEISGTVPSKQKVDDLLKKNFINLPKHITVILPENNISTYDIAKLSNCAIIYGTKMGVELSPFGLPTITCGEAWIKNKGITFDIKDKKNYMNLLSKIPFKKRLNQKKISLAEKYAYHYFFRRMIKVNFIKKINKYPNYTYNFNNISNLKPGKDKGLDIICNGIMNKKNNFINEFN